MSNHFPASAHQPCLKPQGSSNRPILRQWRSRDSNLTRSSIKVTSGTFAQASFHIPWPLLRSFLCHSVIPVYPTVPLHLRPSIFSKLTNLKLSSVFTGFQIEHPLLTCEYVKIVQTLTRLARAGF